jgi:DNA (cytosine-5)-methyltransferase 1
VRAYYNEHDPYAAAWLRNLIAAGHIADGEVDERSIHDVQPEDLHSFNQCHFFAGIGVWSHALRRAGWPDDQPIWTGSCPCQPFSAAGKQEGFADARHLWPVWFRLIDQCHPPIVLGEQVASALDWLDLVSADMEGADYAFGASDLCAAGFGGAHIRQRLYFVGLADTQCNGWGPDQPGRHTQGRAADGRGGATVRLADADDTQSQGRGRVPERAGECAAGAGGVGGGLDDTASARCVGQVGGAEGDPRHEARLCVSGEGRGDGGLADADKQGSSGGRVRGPGEGVGAGARAALERPAGLCENRDTHSPMLGRNPADWLYCRDGKWRPVEPGTFPLVDAAPARVGRLRAYGNALDAETASQFVGAVMQCLP